MIASGTKKEEYREIKEYWISRLEGKSFTHVIFRNGYAKNAPEMMMELRWLKKGSGREEWGANSGVIYYVLGLGKMIYLNRL